MHSNTKYEYLEIEWFGIDLPATRDCQADMKVDLKPSMNKSSLSFTLAPKSDCNARLEDIKIAFYHPVLILKPDKMVLGNSSCTVADKQHVSDESMSYKVSIC